MKLTYTCSIIAALLSNLALLNAQETGAVTAENKPSQPGSSSAGVATARDMAPPPGTPAPPNGFGGGMSVGGFGGVTMAAGQPPSPGRPGEPPQPMFSQRLSWITKSANQRAGYNPLMIYSEPNEKDSATLPEDMRVMAHILEKAVEETTGASPRGRMVLGIDVFSGRAEAVQSLYLEGYGALFLLNVNFPLVAPAGKDNEKPESQAATDTEWEAARREVFGQEEPALAGGSAEAYSEEKVARVKTAVLEALRNAANIRALREEDSVTVCVLGGGAVKLLDGYGTSDAVVALSSSGETAAATVMTVTVKKSDAIAFAKGDLDKEQFGKRARVASYSAPGSAPDTVRTGMGFGAGGFGGGGYGRRGPARTR